MKNYKIMPKQVKLSDKIIHIKADPEFLNNPKNIRFINKLVDRAYHTVKKEKNEKETL